MNIDKALSHFKWKLENSWKPTTKDIEAYNALIDFKETQEDIKFWQNESLAKLWIHQLLLLSNTKNYNGERCIQIIDEILNRGLYEWCILLKNEIPLMRFKSIGLEKYPLGDVYNITQQQKRREILLLEYENELKESLSFEISDENIIKFVKNHINRILNEY